MCNKYKVVLLWHIVAFVYYILQTMLSLVDNKFCWIEKLIWFLLRFVLLIIPGRVHTHNVPILLQKYKVEQE